MEKEINEPKTYMEQIGNFGVPLKDTERFHFGDNMDTFLLGAISPKNREIVSKMEKTTSKDIVSIKAYKKLSLEKEESLKSFFWITPNPKVRKLKADEIKKLPLERCILRNTLSKSLDKQHYTKKDKEIKVVSTELEECPIDIPDTLELNKVFSPHTSSPLMVDEIVESQLINNLRKPLNDYTEAQQINVLTRLSNRFGKVVSVETSNVRLGHYISKLPLKSFGAIGDYNVDSIPLSVVRCKGTVVTWIDTKGKEYQGLQLVSRRFISKIIQFWSYIADTRGKTNYAKYLRALEMWCLKIENPQTKKTYLMVNGEVAISMIRDFLFLIRNQEVNPNKISLNLYNLIRAKSYESKQDFDTILKEMKDRLYHTRQLGDKVWAFPTVHPNYLISLLKELRSGEFDTDTLIPVIKDLYKYPIECKDTHVKQMTETQHTLNLDDYDISKYIFERD